MPAPGERSRSEEHTSELQSLRHLGCRLLLENTPTTSATKGCNTRRMQAHSPSDTHAPAASLFRSVLPRRRPLTADQYFRELLRPVFFLTRRPRRSTPLPYLRSSR